MITSVPLVVDWLLGLDLQFTLIGLLLVALVIMVGRFMLHVAWRLVLIATVVIGALYMLTSFVPGLL